MSWYWFGINRKARRKDKADVGGVGSGGVGLGVGVVGGGTGGGGGGSSAFNAVTYDADHKLYLEETVLERKVPEADLRQLIDLPPGLDLNEWLASHSKFRYLFFIAFLFLTLFDFYYYLIDLLFTLFILFIFLIFFFFFFFLLNRLL